MKQAAIYARVSTEEQAKEGTSLDSQVRSMLAWATKNGYEVPGDYILPEEWSGAVLERPLLDKAKEWAREGKIDAVLVYDWDRLSRDTDHQTILRWMFSEWWGVEVISISEPQLEGFRLKLQRGIDAIFAEWEKEKIRERTLRGKRERARRGRLIGGFRLFGTVYDKDTGTRRKDPQTWPVLCLIFRFVAGGHSLQSVGNYLESLAIPSPSGGRKWHSSTLSGIIHNRAYIGETYAFTRRYVQPSMRRKPLTELRYRKTGKEPRPPDEWIGLPGATPSLIPHELFEAANQRVGSRAAIHQKRKYRYLLTGRLRCSCGGRMHGCSSGRYRYYRCPTARGSLCDARLVNADKLEALAWGEIRRVLLNPELILAHLESRREGELGSVSQGEHTAITQRLANLDVQERRLYRLYASEEYDKKMLDDELDRLGTERSGLQERLKEIETAVQLRQEILDRKKEIEEYCERARENIDSFGFEEKRLALDALNVNVLVKGNDVALSGVIPTHFGIRTPCQDNQEAEDYHIRISAGVARITHGLRISLRVGGSNSPFRVRMEGAEPDGGDHPGLACVTNSLSCFCRAASSWSSDGLSRRIWRWIGDLSRHSCLYEFGTMAHDISCRRAYDKTAATVPPVLQTT